MNTTADTDIWDLFIFISGRWPAGGGSGENSDVNIQITEYGCTVCFNVTNYQPVSGGGTRAGIAGTQAVVGTSGAGIHRPEGGGGG